MKKRKKLLSLALVLLMVLSLLPATVVPAQALEAGTPEDPIRISTATEFNLIRYGLDKHYILVADIDLSGYPDWEPIGSSGENSRFSGTLDGNWHTISNLNINKPGNYWIGLFGYISKPAVIKNLRLTNVNITASSSANVGGLVGVARNDLGTGDDILIENCYVDGIVSNLDYTGYGGETGGLVGYMYSYNPLDGTGAISKCWSDATVTGKYRVGGLVGGVYNASVTNSFATGAVTGEIGVGGLVGELRGDLSYSYAMGIVDNPDGGGLVGSDASATVTSSYYDSETTQMEDTGKGEPKTTAQMQTPETFSDWDTDIWNIAPDQYPVLKNFDDVTLHELTYDLNGGSGTAPEETPKAAFETFLAADSGEFMPPDGLVFKEWNTDADGSGTSYFEGDFIGMPPDAMTLYAIWAPQYTLTYEANGGSNPPASMLYFEDDLFRIASKTGMTVPEGKQFVEWNTAADGSGTSYRGYDLLNMPAQNLTLYAIWEPLQDGSEAAPYLVDDYTDLYGIMFEPDAHFVQTNNITLPDPEEFDFEELGLGSNWSPTGSFTGSFDGGNFTISNLKINSDESAVGFFGSVAGGAVLKNINLVDVEVTSTCDDTENPYVGALAGYNAGTIQTCTVSGIVSGREGSLIDGLVGKNEGTIADCTDNTTITKITDQTLFFNASDGQFHLDDPLGEIKTDLEGWQYDSKSGVLTLNGFTWVTSEALAMFIEADHLTIHLAEGSENLIASVCDNSDAFYSGGILIFDIAGEEGDLTIKGTGSLNVQSGKANEESIGICAAGDVTIMGGTVTASGNTIALCSPGDGSGILVKANKYNYWTNTEASAEGAAGPVNGSTTPFDNNVDPPYKYVKIETIASQGSGSGGGGGSAALPQPTGINFIIPPGFLSDTDKGAEMTFNSKLGNLTVSSNMLPHLSGVEGKRVVINISGEDKNNLPNDLKAAIGNRPLISMTMLIDGKKVQWSNPNAPIKVSIPYAPTDEELLNPENIVIWHIDDSGNVVTIPNGHYDEATKTVTFYTTNFSEFAVAYNTVKFNDVAVDAWYNKAINFIAAREITIGTGSGNFSPDAKLTRGDLMVLLMRAYGIAPDLSPGENFVDAGNTYYTGYLKAAKTLGISEGVGNNLFAPDKEITRQEMFTLMYNILRSIDQLPQGDTSKTISDFSDADQIASWAEEAVLQFVKAGLVEGSAGKLDPTSTTTRAQMAQVLYKAIF